VCAALLRRAQAKADAILRVCSDEVADVLSGFTHRHVPRLRELERKEQERRGVANSLCAAAVDAARSGLTADAARQKTAKLHASLAAAARDVAELHASLGEP